MDTTNERYIGLLTQSVQVTAEACSAWSTGDWARGATLILQAADLEEAALQEAPVASPAA